MSRRTFITTSIPYVNAPPHIGHALEFVEADVVARARRKQGGAVRFQSGTDDHALKNVRAAEAAGRSVAEHVRANADTFAELWRALGLNLDDTIRTSADARHRPAVEALWAACAASGDLYRQAYEGLYCVECEEFYDPEALDDGLCPDHLVAPELVAETNWFFRLTRYADALGDAIETRKLRIEPASARNEILALVARGLRDFSVSRDSTRARGWGIEVPGDPGQVVAVWYDALANYVATLGFGGDDTSAYETWWRGSDERLHVIGKGILRQHAVYWPAILLSVGAPLPTGVFVHGYLTVDGRKIGKSLGNAIDPLAVAGEYGVDALRWWLASELPLSADADFTVTRLVDVADRDLANGLGNLVSRVAALRRRLPAAEGTPLEPAVRLPEAVTAALDRFDLRAATHALSAAVAETNRYLEREQPWRGEDTRTAATVVATAAESARLIAAWFDPFVPALAQAALLRLDDPTAPTEPLFPRRR